MLFSRTAIAPGLSPAQKGVSNFASLIAFPCFGRWFMGADEGVVKVALVPVAVMLS